MKEILFICIGNSKIIGDSFGPVVGSVLENDKRNIREKFNLNISVIGTIRKPLLYKKIEKEIRNIDKRRFCKIIVVDSALGSKSNIGKVLIGKRNNRSW